MCLLKLKTLLILSVLWASYVCESLEPRFRLSNGTVLKKSDIIYIAYGDPLELFCTGQGHDLMMLADYRQLPTTSTNASTIRYYVEQPERSSLHYICKYNEGDHISLLLVVIDSPPTVEDFRCVSMNLDYLNCTWTSKNFQPESHLSYIRDGKYTTLCKTQWFDDSMYCVWDSKHPLLRYQDMVERLDFFMTTCNGVGCVDQTFEFNHRDIVKFDAPRVEISSKDSHSAVLRLIRNTEPYKNFGDFALEQKISYWYAGVNEMQVTTSIVTEDVHTELAELQLPCANEFYDVRVSFRPVLATGDGYWSDDGTISFVTEKDMKVEVPSNPTCNQARAKITKEVMLYKIDQLTENFKEEQNEIKRKIRALIMKAYSK